MHSVNELKKLTTEQQVVASNDSLLNTILLATVNAETGQRGYLLTGNAAYLAPYNTALSRINSEFAALRRMPQKKQDLVAINRLQTTVDQKLTELRSTLNAMNTSGLAAAIAIVNTNQGLMLMNSIRSQVSVIESRQGSSLKEERTHTLDQINSFQDLLVLVRLSALAFIIIGMYLIGRALYQKYELEKNKGEFIDIAAHQLRTPASVIKLHLSAILSGYMGKLSSKQVEAIQTAYDSNEHAIDIVEDVLKVAKVENGDAVLRMRSENLQQLLDEIAVSIKPMLKLRKQKLTRQMPKRPVDTHLDAMYIRMVVENLLDNASKYSAHGSTISLALESDPQRVFIRVTDSGVGIGKKDISKLFKKFSRIKNELSDSITGSGLGLYWAQQIAELHGGKITVRSKKGTGSTFTLELPR
jgi:two-component system cell cycle sensor histidine kinase PleC